jgi:NADP-dependent 3-hydroxy acid dehydrogenase YdfG
MIDLKHKWALITGASSGIGKACAERLAAEGMNLILTARRQERLVTLKQELMERFSISVETFCFDIRDNAQVKSFGASLVQMGITPYILINNAGLAAGRNKIQDGEIDDWEQMIDTNVKGLLYITKAMLPLMIAHNEGQIINIGSTAGHVVYPQGNVYNATKFAVKALNEAINLDLVDTNIKVCSVDPGACDTEFSLVRFKGDAGTANKVYEGYEPLHAVDIAETIYFVCTRPPHVNIQNIVVYPTAQRSVFVHRKEEL